jgi:DNA-binding CsgD family transcriptional regulator/PAS domain-containing protein
VEIDDYSDVIGLIYEASMQPGLWPEVLKQLSVITPSASATLYGHERIGRTATFYHSYGDDPDFTAQYIARWAASNPIIEAIAALEPGDVAPLTAILDYDSFAQTPFFQEWGRPQGFCDVINVMLERTPTRVASLSLIRADRHGMADDAAIRRLRLLAPHVLRAVRIGYVLDHATVEKQRLTLAIDRLADAVLLLDPMGRVIHANDAARDLLDRGLPLARVMRPRTKGSDTTVDGTGQAGSSNPDDVALIEMQDGVRHVCHVLPLANPLMNSGSGVGGPPIMAVIRQRPETELATTTLKTLFALTARERDVLFGLVEVGGLPATAAALGISLGTARSHLKSLFLKTGTHRQADLIALVAEVTSPFSTLIRGANSA